MKINILDPTDRAKIHRLIHEIERAAITHNCDDEETLKILSGSAIETAAFAFKGGKTGNEKECTKAFDTTFAVILAAYCVGVVRGRKDGV